MGVGLGQPELPRISVTVGFDPGQENLSTHTDSLGRFTTVQYQKINVSYIVAITLSAFAPIICFSAIVPKMQLIETVRAGAGMHEERITVRPN